MQKQIIVLTLISIVSGNALAQSNVTIDGIPLPCYQYIDSKNASFLNSNASEKMRQRVKIKGEDALNKEVKVDFDRQIGSNVLENTLETKNK